jgi:hypothetical protein
VVNIGEYENETDTDIEARFSSAMRWRDDLRGGRSGIVATCLVLLLMGATELSKSRRQQIGVQPVQRETDSK